MSVGLANSTVLKLEAGWNDAIILHNTNRAIIFFDLLISTTQTRAAGTGAFGFFINNKAVDIDEPYNLPCIMYQDRNAVSFIQRLESDTVKYLFANQTQWNANTNIRAFGSFIGTIES